MASFFLFLSLGLGFIAVCDLIATLRPTQKAYLDVVRAREVEVDSIVRRIGVVKGAGGLSTDEVRALYAAVG